MASLVLAASLFSALLTTVSADSQCCSVLEEKFPGNIYYPGTSNYTNEASSAFWSSTSRLQPSCVFSPGSAEDVSAAVRVFEANGCKFAVRGGGHMANPGASNIHDGVLIATTKLNELSLHDGFVSVGSGLKWGPVLDFLTPYGLSIVGGRISLVGVAGLTLGGGLSSLSGKRGFACDNVKNFQIVIAGGEIVNANESSNSDLFWALKGGANNFGIVTRFDLYTHTDYKLYGGTMSLDMQYYDEWAAAIDHFTRVTSNLAIADDMSISPKAQWIPFLGPPSLSVPMGSTLLPNGKQCWNKMNGTDIALPPGLSDFLHLPYNFSTSSNMSVQTLADVIRTELPYGGQNELRVVSFRSSVEMLIAMKNIFEEEFNTIADTVEGITCVMEFQPITKRNIREGYVHGGNALGITEDRAPMLWVVMVFGWANASDDETVHDMGQRVVDRVQEHSRQLSLYEPFLFLNDAGVGQSPIATYGEASIQKLQEVSNQYDKAGTFSKLQPGGFKLPAV